jgi:glycosyltransferase involved in cell wall biosynthesis
MKGLRSVSKVALATWFPREPSAPRGGVETVSVVLARALARLDGLQVHVVTVDAQVRDVEMHSWEGVTIHRLPRGGGRLLSFALGSGREMIQNYLYRLRPDIVHSHDTFGIMTRGLRLPRVFTIHGFIHEDTLYAGGLLAKARARLWKRAELVAWAEQPHIISISLYVRERLGGIARGVIHDIENPVAEEYFIVSRAEQIGLVFSAASICRRKNTLGLVQAFSKIAARHPSARLRLAGGVTEPDYAERVGRFIQSAGLRERVELLGSISAAQVRAELSRASVFALVSFEEGAPMGIAEAMAAGVPVVASNRCGMPYMVQDRRTGFLVEPGQSNEIGDCLSHLLADDSLRTQMGASARDTATRQFHPARVAQRTAEVYKKAIAGCREIADSNLAQLVAPAISSRAGDKLGHLTR